MILPIISVNISLVRELSPTELRTCGERFAPLLGAALVGTVVGMALLQYVPAAPLKVGLGLVTLAFVATAQHAVHIPGQVRVQEGCFVESPVAMAGIGGISGLLFGGTNVGVQLVAYLRSCDLSHGLFVGVVAMVFLGFSAVRVGTAAVLGLNPSVALVGASVAAGVPALVGVAVRTRFRDRISERHRRLLVLGLLAVIGVRLVTGGLGL
jgi:uncharacterized membrane protein YfcA